MRRDYPRAASCCWRRRRCSAATTRPPRRFTARAPCRASIATTRRSSATTRSSRRFPARAMRPRRSTWRAGSTSTAVASARACRICRPRWITSARATSPTTPPGAWRSRTTCWAKPIRRWPASSTTRSCRATTAPATSAASASATGARASRTRPDARPKRSPAIASSIERGPLSFYGLLARARLRALGEVVPMELPRIPTGRSPAPRRAVPPGNQGTIPASRAARADELLEAGMDVEAGWELERNEESICKRRGDARGLPMLLDRYRACRIFTARSGWPRAAAAGAGDGAQGARRGVLGGALPAGVQRARRKIRPAGGQPRLVPLRDHAQGVGVLPARRLVRGRARPVADDPPTSAKVAARRARRSLPTSSTSPRPTSASAPLHRLAVPQVR